MYLHYKKEKKLYSFRSETGDTQLRRNPASRFFT